MTKDQLALVLELAEQNMIDERAANDYEPWKLERARQVEATDAVRKHLETMP